MKQQLFGFATVVPPILTLCNQQTKNIIAAEVREWRMDETKSITIASYAPGISNVIYEAGS